MKKVKAFFIKALAAFLAIFMFGVFVGCSDPAPTPDPAPIPIEDPDEPVIDGTATAFGNIRKTVVIDEPSDDVSIKLTRGRNIIGSGEGKLEYAGALQAGDVVSVMSDYRYIKLNLFDKLGEAIVYAPTGEFSFRVPEDISAYDSATFSGAKQTFTAYPAEDTDLSASRNLAANPYDYIYDIEHTQHDIPDAVWFKDSTAVAEGEVLTYPHAYANRVTRNEATFMARNAIDGKTVSNGHGNYPYQSWGYNNYDDAEFCVYFGREVKLNKLEFVLRADYSGTPEHDTYWEKVTAEFSDGSTKECTLSKSGAKQSISLGDVTTTYVRLKNPIRKVSANSQMFAALTELEVWGTEKSADNAVAEKEVIVPTFGGKKVVKTTNELHAADVKAKIEEINDWYLEESQQDNVKYYATHLRRDLSAIADDDDWVDSVYYTGLIDAYMATGKTEYYTYLRGISEKFVYKVNSGRYTNHSDDYLIGETFLFMNELHPADYKFEGAKYNADRLIAVPESLSSAEPNDSPKFPRSTTGMNLWWCDSMYMAMNTYSLLTRLTGDTKYIEAAYYGYKYWKDILFDTKYNLWVRDRSWLNKKIEGTDVQRFWARGNAWVHAALAKTLLYIEDEDSDIYKALKADFIELSESLKKYQRADGTWDPTIVLTDHMGPETTGTAGFLYGYATGVSLGILDYDTYFPVIKKAYISLTETFIIAPGQLGYMQTLGQDPDNYSGNRHDGKPFDTREFTNEFGMGLFLLGASAVLRMCEDYTAPELVVPADPQGLHPTISATKGYLENNGSFTVTCGGYQNADGQVYPPENLFDGDTDNASRWSNEGYSKSWVKVDLGKTYTLDRMCVVTYQPDKTKMRNYQYYVEVSEDGTAWKTVIDTRSNEIAKEFNYHTFDSVAARHVRITVTGEPAQKSTWCSIKELFLYERSA